MSDIVEDAFNKVCPARDKIIKERIKMVENKRYRLLEVEDIPQGFTTYIIEKRVKFLFWRWWSRGYLYNGFGKHYKGEGHYHFSPLERGRAERTL